MAATLQRLLVQPPLGAMGTEVEDFLFGNDNQGKTSRSK